MEGVESPVDVKKWATVLPPVGSTIHLCGICGTGMASLAGLLLENGYNVQGSDTAYYPPMGKVLQDLKITLFNGYSPKNLYPRPDFVIIGNVIRADNPEARAVIESGIPYTSFPAALSSLLLQKRFSLVVAGTHGKTTTSTLLVSALEGCGQDVGFLIGGVLKSHGTGFHLGKSEYFVVEGDEYDTAFFDKRPKFVHYAPKAAVLTSIEFDHADIYENEKAVEEAFQNLAGIIPENGLLVACRDWPIVRRVLKGCAGKVITYGLTEQSDYQLMGWKDSGGRVEFEIVLRKGERISGSLAMPGMHNALNCCGIIALCTELGLPIARVMKGLSQCSGVKRRQEVLGEVNGRVVIDDFAHHPSAVSATLEALKARYPDRRLVAIFEPRTNTSRRAIFQNRYPSSFRVADLILVREVPDPEKAPEGDRFSSARLVEDLKKLGKEAFLFSTGPDIVKFLQSASRPGDVISVLSNGPFEGIHGMLLEAFRDEAVA